MKKTGIVHAGLAGALASLRHTELVVVSDAGLPVLPTVPGPRVVDLGYRYGMPPFADVLDAVLAELVVDHAVAAEEVQQRNPDCHVLLREHFPGLELVPHDELKAMVPLAALLVRTGEATPYANVVLTCGVPF